MKNRILREEEVNAPAAVSTTIRMIPDSIIMNVLLHAHGLVYNYCSQYFDIIGHVSIVLENEDGGTWGQEVHFLHVKRYDFVLVLIVRTGMSPQLCLYPADAYTGRELSLFATINKQELLLLIKVI